MAADIQTTDYGDFFTTQPAGVIVGGALFGFAMVILVVSSIVKLIKRCCPTKTELTENEESPPLKSEESRRSFENPAYLTEVKENSSVSNGGENHDYINTAPLKKPSIRDSEPDIDYENVNDVEPPNGTADTQRIIETQQIGKKKHLRKKRSKNRNSSSRRDQDSEPEIDYENLKEKPVLGVSGKTPIPHVFPKKPATRSKDKNANENSGRPTPRPRTNVTKETDTTKTLSHDPAQDQDGRLLLEIKTRVNSQEKVLSVQQTTTNVTNGHSDDDEEFPDYDVPKSYTHEEDEIPDYDVPKSFTG